MSNQQRNIVSSTLRTTFACCKKLLGKFVFQDVISICPAKVLEKNFNGIFPSQVKWKSNHIGFLHLAHFSINQREFLCNMVEDFGEVTDELKDIWDD